MRDRRSTFRQRNALDPAQLIKDILEIMRTLTLLLLSILLAFSTATAGPVKMEVGQADFAIVFDPTQPIAIVWLSYCIGRLHYVVEHRSDYPRKVTGELTPTFKEEVEGRFTALDTYKNMTEQKKLDTDSYWEDVKKVAAADFLDEYVWTYFYRDTWAKTKKPAKLEKFGAWQKKNLPNHKAVTYGAIAGK